MAMHLTIVKEYERALTYNYICFQNNCTKKHFKKNEFTWKIKEKEIKIA